MTGQLLPDAGEADRRLIEESGLFDIETYLRDHPEVAVRGLDPIEHYLTEGWLQDADPGPGFSTRYYLSANPDVQRAGVNPLLHYLRAGKDEGREPLPPDRLRKASTAAPSPQAPTEEDWARLLGAKLQPSEEPVVDVIVPVYRGFNETLRCIYSVLAAPQVTPYRLVVVNDHSPEPELVDALNRLGESGWIELHTTPENRGFVGACNLGMRLHPERDVLLLNSDTEVHNDWLDRLRAAALRDPHTGTVTPFSNNATICSYPRFTQNNWRALEISDAELDRLAAHVNAGAEVDIPTGVGFCMYIRRACLEEVGLFDQETFGLGYGEECDFCRRAAAAGWRNILAADVFVRHHGAASFGSSKAHRMREAEEKLQRLHPDYPKLVADFLRRDPPSALRGALDMARIARRAERRGAILFVTHRWGGGVERHVQDLAEILEAEGVPVFFCRIDPKDPSRLRLSDPVTPETPNLPSYKVAREVHAFADALRRMGVSHVHVHNMVDCPESTPDFIRLASRLAGIAYDVTLHDYVAICPRINLIDGSGLYCAEPALATCETCIERHGSPFGHPSVWDWRERYSRLLTGARRVFVPDADVSQRMRRHIPGVTYYVRPHPERGASVNARRESLPEPGTMRRVGLIGAIGPHKGSRLLIECARIALQRRLPLRFIVVGFTDREAEPELANLANVLVTGKYREEELQNRLAETGADVAWFPSVWPETYSYTLSAALAARLFPVAFDFGAIASRLREIGWGYLMPIQWMLHPDRVAEELAHMPLQPPPDTELLPARNYPRVLESYYGFSGEFACDSSAFEQAGT